MAKTPTCSWSTALQEQCATPGQGGLYFQLDISLFLQLCRWHPNSCGNYNAKSLSHSYFLCTWTLRRLSTKLCVHNFTEDLELHITRIHTPLWWLKGPTGPLSDFIRPEIPKSHI